MAPRRVEAHDRRLRAALVGQELRGREGDLTRLTGRPVGGDHPSGAPERAHRDPVGGDGDVLVAGVEVSLDSGKARRGRSLIPGATAIANGRPSTGC